MITQNNTRPGFLGKFFEVVSIKIETTRSSIKFFGIVMAINFPLYWIIWNKGIAINGNYTDLILRLCATFLCFGLIYKKVWEKISDRLFIIYWCFTVIFCLPFFFTFMTLKYHGSTVWLMNFMSSFFFLFLLFDLITALTIFLMGASAGCLAFYYLMPPFYLDLGSINLFEFFCTIFAALIIGGLFSYKKEHIQEAKRQSLKMQAGAIAHEMRTPLAAIDGMVDGLKQHLPTLLQTQEIAQEKDQSIPYIYQETLQALSEVPDELKVVSKSAFTVIDMLLMNLKDDVPETLSEKCSILKCAEIALHEYSLRESDKNLISLEIKHDFEFYGNSLLIKHVFFNLLKNALHYVKAARKGKITIWTETSHKVNKLYFEDTGKGISKEHLPHIFDQFFTRTAYGTGVGLAFCKMVMTKLGGDITCDSIEGEFTRFTLSFPILEEDNIS